MNRLKYSTPALEYNESSLAVERNVNIHDGDSKRSSFEGGEVTITTQRIIWTKGGVYVTLPLSLIVYIEEESPNLLSFSRTKKIILHLSEPENSNAEAIQSYSQYNFIKLSFKNGYESSSDVPRIINDAIQRRQREVAAQKQQQLQLGGVEKKKLPEIKTRTGIVGIERNLEERQRATDQSISVAFQDLSKLMTMAKDMVQLSRAISNKIKDKQGDITEDETVRFKSYLMSLGIDDPVTRDGFTSTTRYIESLARQICTQLEPHVEQMGGMMSLPDVFCRVNRARALELLSPDDILHACQAMANLDLPLRLYQFSESGVWVLRLSSLDEESVAEATAILLESNGSMNAEELAQNLGISIILAKERLVNAEKLGKLCRDDSIEGIRFYPNLLLLKG